MMVNKFTDLRERKRTSDVITLANLALLFVAAALPWFVQLATLNMQRVAWLLCGATGIYLIITAVTDAIGKRWAQGLAIGLLQILHAAAVVLVWNEAGGMDRPLMLAFAAVPPLVCALIGQMALATGLAIAEYVTVAVFAIQRSAELGWLLGQLGVPAWSLSVGRARESGVDGEMQAAILAVFAVVLIGGITAGHLSRRAMMQLDLRLRTSAEIRSSAADLFRASLKADPTPTLVALADSGRVVHASDGFRQQMLLHGRDVVDTNLEHLVRFASPVAVARLMQSGGTVPGVHYTVGTEERSATLRSVIFEHNHARYALLSFFDEQTVNAPPPPDARELEEELP